jgi:hypothetical protein
MSLILMHIELGEANDFVALHHRHHKPVVGHRFSIGVREEQFLVGVAIVGRPVARNTDYRACCEVSRLCTDGTKNACSFLYAACARAAAALGYLRIQTFILDSETGVSLKAAGWVFDHMSAGGSHTRKNRPRRDDQPQCPKQLWRKDLRHAITYLNRDLL